MPNTQKPSPLLPPLLMLLLLTTVSGCGHSRAELIAVEPPPRPLIPASLKEVPPEAQISGQKRSDAILRLLEEIMTSSPQR